MDKNTKIHIIGEFNKEDLAKIVRIVATIQKEKNPEGKIEKYFYLWISNDVYSNDEVKKIIEENFEDFKVTDMDEETEDEIYIAMQKNVAG